MVYRVDVKHITHFLTEVDIFRGLLDRHLDRIAAICEERSFQAGEFLGIQEQAGNWLYVIRRGEITVTSTGPRGSLVVRTVRQHETLPVAVLFDPPKLVTTAQAATDGEALALSRVRLLELCELEPRIGMHIYRAVCRILMSRYRYTLQALSETVSGDAIHIDPTWEGTEV